MTDNSFIENEDRQALRKSVSAWASNYGAEYYLKKARAHQHTTELWSEAGKLGFLGVNLPEEYGGGGAGMYELSLVMEEMAAAGSALLLMVVSPAINGTIISKFGTDEQKKRWIPSIADGTLTMAFAITEPDAGSNSHKITTTARRDGGDWILKGQKVYISGIDQAQAEYPVACLPEHQFALSRTRKHVFDDLHMLFNPVWDRTVIGAEHHSVHTAHFNRGSQSDWVETHAVDQDVSLEVVGWRPIVLVRLAGRRVADTDDWGPPARTPALVRLKGCLIRKVQVLPRPGSRPVTNDNCVAVRRGGEQSEVNDSSVRKKLDSAGVGGEPASDVRSPDPGTPVLGEVQRAD